MFTFVATQIYLIGNKLNYLSLFYPQEQAESNLPIFVLTDKFSHLTFSFCPTEKGSE